MRVFILFLIILTLPNIYAACEEGQVDINNADKQELMKIVYIGEARAQLIIDSRTYESVDDLIKIKGIGEVYLSKIKDQGLACVGGEESEKKAEEKKIEEIKEKNSTEEKKETTNENKEEIKEIEIKKIEPEVIRLTAKNIKTEEYKEDNSDNKNYATYGFVIFCVLLTILFITRKKQLNKTEF